jgi:DNA-binding transcriptional MerR regulator
MTIGELAKRADLDVQTIRYYEREGLLPPARRWHDNNYRDFDQDALLHLRFIRCAKSAGFSLREIKQLLDLSVMPSKACAELAPLLSEKLGEIYGKIEELRQLRKTLLQLQALSKECSPGKSCAVLKKLEQGDSLRLRRKTRSGNASR